MATLIAPTHHSPQEDAEALRKAVKGQIILYIQPPLVWLMLIEA